MKQVLTNVAIFWSVFGTKLGICWDSASLYALHNYPAVGHTTTEYLSEH